MLLQIILFEIKYRLNRPATYIYFAILFGFSFLIITLPDSTVSEAGEQLHKNSPYVISQLVGSFVLFGSIILAGIMGVPVYREYDHNFNEIIFTLPVKKWEYLSGKFIGSYLIAVFVHLGIILGLMIGTFMPWLDDTDLGPFMLSAYLTPLFTFLLPNLFILGSIFFTVGTLSRSQLAIYAQGLILMVLYFVLSTLMNDVDTNPVNSIFEPFGSVAASFETKYWTTYEKNNLMLPFSGYILINRAIWTAFGILVGIFCYLLFTPMPDRKLFGRKKTLTQMPDQLPGKRGLSIPAFEGDFSIQAQLYQLWYFSKFYFNKVIKAIPFWIMLACGIGLLLLGQFGMSMLGAKSLPVTYMLLDFLQTYFIIFVVIIIALYSGELIWKDVDVKIAPVIDSSPVSDKVLVISKFFAMILVELLIIGFIILTGIGVQISQGFYHFQVDVYLKVLFLQTFTYMVVLTFLVFLIHTLINNKYLGHTLVVVFFVLQIFSGQLGIEHILTQYGNSIEKSYSDMNGFSNFVFPTLIVYFYWSLLGIIFLLFSILFIKRGNIDTAKERIKNMQISLRNSNFKWIIPALLLAFVLTGAFIYYNTNVLNTFRNKKSDRNYKAEYELTYSRYINYPNPRITDVKIEADLYPKKTRVEMRGQFKLVNKNDVNIDTFHIQTSPWITVNNLSFSIPVEMIDSSKDYGYYMYKTKSPVLPGDSLSMNFNFLYQEKGFNHWGHSTQLVHNGTFLHDEFVPHFGYSESQELKDKKERKKAGLPEKEYESPEITDTAELANVYISENADRINYECILSTDLDQTAITCGTLVNEWTENDRRFFKYKMHDKMWNFYPFLSAKYEILKEEYNGVEIAIYYHKTHDYNIDKMVKAVKMTIDYCNTNFFPYQHDAIRIVEFPRYQNYAQSFAGTIPFSEGVGFIAQVDKKNEIDLPFYVTAHEVAHQWWGHQICAAGVQGMTLPIESLAEYTAMMVLKEEYGDKNADKFQKYQLDRYMLLRATERKKEPPLYLVDNQQYLSYQKGCLAFNAIRNYIGEDSLNLALSKFVKKYYYQDAPYPTSLDLIGFVEDMVPDSLQYLINDWFMNITLYSNRTDSVFYSETDNGKYLVDVYTTSIKYQADSLGKQDALELNDWIDLGIYTKTEGKEDSLIYLKKVLLNGKNNKFSVEVNSKPVKAGIDPLFLQIDRNMYDNTKEVKKSES
ncbi:MAG: ABC transporter permease subunit [Bacteroidales bacterium]|nr:ABC transporter permease subunit [Bacteroidales bacterium]MBN2819734.1 ABC transporter permease subunit [Bacteroidales bacterium]